MGNELCFAMSENRVKWSASLIVDLAKKSLIIGARTSSLGNSF